MTAHGKGITGAGIFDLKEDVHSVRAYVMEHIEDLEDYVETTYPDESFDGHIQDLLANPYVARTAIENFVTPNELKFRNVVEYYSKVGTALTITIGRKRHWKTITTSDLAYEVHRETHAYDPRPCDEHCERGRPVYMVGAMDAVPWFAYHVLTIEEVPEGAIVVQDEAAVEASSRTSMSGDQRALPAQLATAGHNKILHFVVVQNTSIMDKSILTMADAFLFKPASLTQGSTERSALRKIYDRWKEVRPRQKWESLLVTSDTNPWTFQRPIPLWWEQSLSHAFANIRTEADALEHASKLREMGRGWTTIATRLRQRGFAIPANRLAEKVRKFNGGEDPADPGQATAPRY